MDKNIKKRCLAHYTVDCAAFGMKGGACSNCIEYYGWRFEKRKN